MTSDEADVCRRMREAKEYYFDLPISECSGDACEFCHHVASLSKGMQSSLIHMASMRMNDLDEVDRGFDTMELE